MSFTREELEELSFTKLLKVAKFSGVYTYRKNKEQIIDDIYDVIQVSEEVVEVEPVQRSVRVQRIYEQNRS